MQKKLFTRFNLICLLLVITSHIKNMKFYIRIGKTNTIRQKQKRVEYLKRNLNDINPDDMQRSLCTFESN